jgi:hypothetical protein
MPIDGRARVLGMEFGVGDFFLFCLNKQIFVFLFKGNPQSTPKNN